MSASIQGRKFGVKNADVMYGIDADTTQLITNLVSEGVKTGGSWAAETQRKKQQEAAMKDQKEAEKAAKDARKKAYDLKAEAAREDNPSGPKHKEADQADRYATALEERARSYASMSGVPPGGMTQGYQPQSGGSSVFTTKNILIGAGVLAAGIVGIMIFKRRR